MSPFTCSRRRKRCPVLRPDPTCSATITTGSKTNTSERQATEVGRGQVEVGRLSLLVGGSRPPRSSLLACRIPFFTMFRSMGCMWLVVCRTVGAPSVLGGSLVLPFSSRFQSTYASAVRVICIPCTGMQALPERTALLVGEIHVHTHHIITPLLIPSTEGIVSTPRGSHTRMSAPCLTSRAVVCSSRTTTRTGSRVYFGSCTQIRTEFGS